MVGGGLEGDDGEEGLVAVDSLLVLAGTLLGASGLEVSRGEVDLELEEGLDGLLEFFAHLEVAVGESEQVLVEVDVDGVQRLDLLGLPLLGEGGGEACSGDDPQSVSEVHRVDGGGGGGDGGHGVVWFVGWCRFRPPIVLQRATHCNNYLTSALQIYRRFIQALAQ